MATFTYREAKLTQRVAGENGIGIQEGIYGITSSNSTRSHVEVAQAMVLGGIPTVQLRLDDSLDFETQLDTGLRVSRICEEHGARLIVNDNIDLAVAIGADGIHLGPEDMPLAQARREYAGWLEGRIVGLSAYTEEEARAAQDAGVGYIGLGLVFGTRTKPRLNVIGYDGLGRMVGLLRDREPETQTVAIGGFKVVEQIDELIRIGVRRVAVMSAILEADDMVAAARKWVEEWERRSKTL